MVIRCRRVQACKFGQHSAAWHPLRKYGAQLRIVKALPGSREFVLTALQGYA